MTRDVVVRDAVGARILGPVVLVKSHSAALRIDVDYTMLGIVAGVAVAPQQVALGLILRHWPDADNRDKRHRVADFEALDFHGFLPTNFLFGHLLCLRGGLRPAATARLNVCHFSSMRRPLAISLTSRLVFTRWALISRGGRFHGSSG